MYVVEDNHDLVYTKIKEGALQGSCSVLIFVAVTIDALCASRILVTLLKSDFITFKLIPVTGYNDLSQANEEIIQDNADLRSIIMLDCGGMADLSELFSLTDQMQVFVMDTHRPYHLSNLFENDNIYLFDDGDIRADEQKFMALRESYRYLSHDATAAAASSSDNDSEDEGSDTRKRHVERRTHRRRLADYYANHSYGTSVSRLLYSLATRLVKSNNELLWLAIVGVTDQYLSHRLRHDRYLADIHEFSRDVLQFNLCDDDNDNSHNLHYQRREGAHDDSRLSDLAAYFKRHFHSSDVLGRLSFADMERLQYLLERHHASRKRKSPSELITVDPYNDNDDHENPSATEGLSTAEQHELHLLRMKLLSRVQEGKIAFSEELHLVLLRHWSLYESLLYSPVTATLLATHTEKGRRQLHHCLAKMGFPLKQCQQKYLMMDLQLKQSLAAKLQSTLMTGTAAATHVSLVYGSFTRQYNWKTCLSASDVVYGLQSLLYESSSSSQEKENNGELLSESVLNGKEDVNVLEGAGRERATRQFYAAYDALKDTEALLRGIHAAKDFHQRVAKQVHSILERKLVISTRSLRFVTLAESGDASRRMAHPRSLMQLAFLLVDASASKKRLPLVLAALNGQTQYYTVVGWMKGGRQSANSHGFGVVFKEAAERTRSQTRHDQFDTCVIDVYKEDMTRFMEYLQLHAGQYGL